MQCEFSMRSAARSCPGDRVKGSGTSLILLEDEPVEKSLPSPLVYLPNNPFTDLIGFCAAGFFTIPLAACFSILPISA